MKERPVLFSAPMVRAILDGRKTVTRRIIKDSKNYSCPYGDPHDRLWVRETFVIEDTREYWDDGKNDLPTDRPYKWAAYYNGYRPLIPHYRATEPEPHIVREETMIDADDDRTRWMPSIFMPRWASRIDLEITGVRVERLQEITPEDAIAEGLVTMPEFDWTAQKPTGRILAETAGSPAYWASPKTAFESLWETINGAGSWDANPWVWVVEFKRIT